MTPTERILSRTGSWHEVDDTLGRRIRFRAHSVLDHFRMLKIAGPDLAKNDAWMNLASLAYAVTEIDGVPRALPVNESQIEQMISELGSPGIQAIIGHLSTSEQSDLFTLESAPGKASGTPSSQNACC